MIVETGYLNSIHLHDDGRVTMIRTDPHTGTFLHIEFSEQELAAIERALAQRALDSGAKRV